MYHNRSQPKRLSTTFAAARTTEFAYVDEDDDSLEDAPCTVEDAVSMLEVKMDLRKLIISEEVF